MRRGKIGISIVVVVLCGLSVSGAQPGRAAGPILFTPQDAEVLRLTEAEWTEPLRSRDLSVGPRIVFQRPQIREAAQGPMLETSTPMDLLVVFEARGVAVDMQSLQVQACKGPFCKSLTKTLRRALVAAADVPLFNTLRDWRAERSKREGVPPYVICTNRQFTAIWCKREA